MSIWTRITEALAALVQGEPLSVVFDKLRTAPAPEQSVGLKISIREAKGEALLLTLGQKPYFGEVLFEDDSATIRPRFLPIIERFSADINELASEDIPVVIAITGYTDRRGPERYNDELGLRRARSLYEAIAERLTPEARSRIRVEIDRSADKAQTQGREGRPGSSGSGT